MVQYNFDHLSADVTNDAGKFVGKIKDISTDSNGNIIINAVIIDHEMINKITCGNIKNISIGSHE